MKIDFSQKSPLQLKDLLSEAYARIEELERRNRELEKRLSKFSTQSAKTRQQVKSLQGQLRAERAKVQSLTTTIRAQKVKIRKIRAREREAQQAVKSIKQAIRDIAPKLSRDQLFELYKDSNQRRFWDRVTQVHQFDPEKLAEMKARMSTWSSQKLRDIIRIGGWRSTWYDSDADWNSSEMSGWDERNLYAFIMSY